MAKKILIIEDYQATAKMIEEILEMEGFESTVAVDGKVGIEKAVTEKPDLILLDIMLPKTDGLEVCSQLKNNPQTKDIPVVMISVKASDEEIKAGLARGASDYITKPFDPFKLIEVIKKHFKLG